MAEQHRPRIPHRVVRASAGAGKTYQLTTRYLELLRRGEPMQQVLATTFTRKAAGEVLARVLGRLAGACSDETQRNQLGEALGDRSLSHSNCLTMLRVLIDGLDRLSVGTIDGFFNRAARALSLELGLPASPRLIDEGSPLARQMRADAIHAVLGEQGATDDGMLALIEMLRRLHHDNAQRSVTDAIDDIVVKLDEVYRVYRGRALWDALPTVGLLDAGLLSTALHALDDMSDTVPRSSKNKTYAAFADRYHELLADARAGRWDRVLSNGLIKKVGEGAAKYGHAPIDEAWHRAVRPLFIHAKAHRIARLAEQTRATYDLLALFNEQYTRQRYGQGVLLFSDLTHVLAEGLPGFGELSGETPGAGVEELCYRLDTRVMHLLLDEFQDTSLRQWQVLAPFAEQIVAGGEDSRSLFCVGDTKQAIYGWRGGCAELFEQVEALPGVEQQSLSTSWRSSPVILEAVNQVFTSLATNPALEKCRDAADAWQGGFQTHVAERTGLAGHVVLQTTALDSHDSDSDPDEDDPAAPADAHARAVAGYIQQLEQQQPGRSIGVLVRRRAAALRLMHELRSLGVFAAEEGGNPIDNAPAVGAVLSAIQIADHPGDAVARFHVINSPLGEALGLVGKNPPQDLDASAHRTRLALLDRGYAGVIGEWVERLAPHCDATSLRRLMQLVELAEVHDERDAGLRPGFFVDAVRAARIEDPSPARVRVMTIHAAKGLEFDTVVLPDLDGVLSKSDAREQIVLDRDSPIDPVRAVYRRAKDEVMRLLPELERAVEQRTREKRTEDLCLLYVAMTRARHALHMLVRPLKPLKNGGPSGEGRTNLSYAAVLRQALCPDDDEGFGGHELLHESGDAAWSSQGGMADKRHEYGPSTPRPMRSIKLSDDSQGRGRSWVQTSPSEMHESGSVSAAELLRRSPGAGQSYGTLMHALIEQVGFVDEQLPDAESLEATLAQHGDPAIDPRRVLDSFNRALEAAAVRSLLERDGAGQLWRERPFVVRLADRLVRGTFDRVHLWTGPDGRATRALLIDFKTDRVDDANVAEVVASYTDQLGLYRDALMTMTGLEPGAIETRLCFVGDARVETVN